MSNPEGFNYGYNNKNEISLISESTVDEYIPIQKIQNYLNSYYSHQK